MSIETRIILIVFSILSLVFCIIKIKQSKLKVTDTVSWILGCLILIIMAIFPGGIIWIANLIGIQSPANLVFLIFIGFLLIQAFIYNIKITALNEKIKDLDHYIALKEYKKGENDNEK